MLWVTHDLDQAERLGRRRFGIEAGRSGLRPGRMNRRRETAAMNVIPLTPLDLALAASLVLAIAVLSWYLRLGRRAGPDRRRAADHRAAPADRPGAALALRPYQLGVRRSARVRDAGRRRARDPSAIEAPVYRDLGLRSRDRGAVPVVLHGVALLADNPGPADTVVRTAVRDSSARHVARQHHDRSGGRARSADRVGLVATNRHRAASRPRRGSLERDRRGARRLYPRRLDPDHQLDGGRRNRQPART